MNSTTQNEVNKPNDDVNLMSTIERELNREIEKSLIECFMYGKSAINHNPPLVEYRRLKHLVSKALQIAVVSAKLKEAREIQNDYWDGEEFDADALDYHIIVLKKQKAELEGAK